MNTIAKVGLCLGGLGLLMLGCTGSSEEASEADADEGAITAGCTGGVSKYSRGVNESTDVDSIQQARASKAAGVPSQAFNGRTFSRPVPLHIKMAHHFFPGDSPITGYPHEGLDYSGVGNQRASDIEGQPIHAITSGKVVFVLSSCVAGRATRMCGDGWGNQVIIDHGGNVFSRYAHMGKDSALVKVGQEVQTGQKLGKIGMTGFTLGPHLHLEVGTMKAGTSVNACAPTKFTQVYNPWLNLLAVDTKAPALSGPAPAAPTAPAAPATPAPGSTTSCKVTDPDGFTHLRQNGAGTVLASVKQGQIVSVRGASGASRQVALEGWISSSLTSCNTAVCPTEVLIADADPAKLGEASGTNLRTDKATDSPLAAVVSNGTSVSVIAQDGNRLRVSVVGMVSAEKCE